ncbi:MAG: MarR family transcriptional regulator [Candidatus Micrarchaeota archaeon]|nr:MarR family transcriptional regulator [Candidatus Micrarchaeota archaeon]
MEKNILEELFTSYTRIRVLAYILPQGKVTYYRQLSKELGISVSAIKREVDNLVAAGILKKTAGRVHANPDCPVLEELRSIFSKCQLPQRPQRKVRKKEKKIRQSPLEKKVAEVAKRFSEPPAPRRKAEESDDGEFLRL